MNITKKEIKKSSKKLIPNSSLLILRRTLNRSFKIVRHQRRQCDARCHYPEENILFPVTWNLETPPTSLPWNLVRGFGNLSVANWKLPFRAYSSPYERNLEQKKK